MLRERFDRIEIIDLRGDVRRGERAGVENDQGVFNIQVGTAITIAIAEGQKRKASLASVNYIDTWGQDLFSRRSKLDWLTAGSESGSRAGGVSVDRTGLEDFKPKPFDNGELLSLSDLFAFVKSGIKTQNDDVLIATNRHRLEHQVNAFLAEQTPSKMVQVELSKPTSYRPLDIRWLYNDPRLVRRHGPELQAAWGASNICLYAMPFATGAGPAAWCHGQLPDYHAFRGSYGGYAFPLNDNRPGHGPSNISLALLQGLALTYGQDVSASDVFDAILCLLSAQSYTLRFAEDLEDTFPHIPFPSDLATFREAAALGAEIRAVETFARPPGAAFLTRATARVETEATGVLSASDWRNGDIFLCENGSGRVSGIPLAVWEFAVSGYRVLPRWLKGRDGQTVDNVLISGLRDVAGRIAELLDLFARADTTLERALASPLGRSVLGLGGATETARDDDGSDT